jgi:hypothetical protein
MSHKEEYKIDEILGINSYAWRGHRGVGKRTQLLKYLEKKSELYNIPFEIKYGTWYLSKQINSGDPDEEDEGDNGKSIPYEESNIHLGFNVARMSMSDKVFLQSILTRWTGQNDVCLTNTTIKMRYLVLYHAHYLTDESVLQLQEYLEQYPSFSILLTTELPLCDRLKDYCLEIPVAVKDHNRPDLLLNEYNERAELPDIDVWKDFFICTLNDWSQNWSPARIVDIRNWIYICLQRNLRWVDVIMYWIEVIYSIDWITPSIRSKLLEVLYNSESSAGWVLITSYRIPILWEHVHLKFAKVAYEERNKLMIP